jgi:hypothetical protein
MTRVNALNLKKEVEEEEEMHPRTPVHFGSAGFCFTSLPFKVMVDDLQVSIMSIPALRE